MASEENLLFADATLATAALCGGAGCGNRRKSGELPRRKAAGTQLCTACGSALAADLAAIPRLYDECGRVLGGMPQSRETGKTTGGGLPGLPFNTAAAEARAAILGILTSWCVLVAEERFVTPPRRNARALATFLSRHLSWLTAHAAANDLSREVAKVTRRARRCAYGSQVRQVRIGRCAESGCPGELNAALGTARTAGLTEIVCSSDPGHRWAGHEWLRLSRRLSGAAPAGAAPAGAAPAGAALAGDSLAGAASADDGRAATHRAVAAATAGAAARSGLRWLTPAQISRLWEISPGSVYRLASERQWGRRSRSGRVYYDAGDVEKTMRERRDG